MKESEMLRRDGTLRERTWVVIMAGGSGTRFWPWSRRAHPKQCLPVLGDRSLLSATLERARLVADPDRILVVAASGNADAVGRELGGDERLLVEPMGRNTAACVAWACRVVEDADPQAVVAVLPADHFVGDLEAFRRDATEALALAAGEERWLTTIGVPPTRAETGYGWIELGGPVPESDGGRIVRRFTEKPDMATAERWLAEGGWLWNSGMFFFRADRMMDELRRWLPGHAALPATTSSIDEATYAALEPISLDHGVMERAESGVAVVPSTFPWSDVGSWTALGQIGGGGDGDGGSFVRGRVVEIDGGANVLVAQGGAVATLGVRGLAVVHAGDAVLVCPVDRAQEVRRVVQALTEAEWDDLL